MFASHLISTVVNGLRPVANPNQSIELQPGQIFRGTIMRAYPNNIVQVQLAGGTLMAELNAPLSVGQQAWLQVMPKSHPITLKVIDTPRSAAVTSSNQAEVAEKSSLEGLLRAIGFKADKVNVQNLQLLMQAGIPLKSEEIGAMLQLLRYAAAPEQTIPLIHLANQRGLPLTGEVIRSLESVFFGKSFTEITQQITQLGQQSNNNQQLQSLIQQMNQLWQNARAQLSLISPQVMSTSPNATAVHADVPSTPVMTQPSPMLQTASTVQQAPVHSMPDGVHLPREGQVSQAASPPTASVTAQGSLMRDNNPVAMNTIALPVQDSGNANAPQNGLLNFLKILGVNYDASMSQRLGMSTLDSNAIKQDVLSQLKGVLLELRGLENISTAMREAVDQGIRMVTGQQLLFVNDTNTPWNSFIFQIPLTPMHREGEPSYIHIEGRKKGRDVIDSENCRLFFHLDLEHLHTTMIDIQITSRIMNIHIYNDRPQLKQMIEDYREKWKEAMLDQDYQLSSIKVLPIPNVEEQKVHTSPLPVQQSSYQGVDLRI